jgi:hypothetical protein
MGMAARASVTAGRAGRQRGLSLIGLLFWAILVASVALLAMKVLPSLNEYFTIQRAVNKLAASGATTVAEVRNAFERQKDIEYSISSIGGKDLDVSKENDRLVIRFGYDKEIELVDPVFLVIKFRGRSQ